MCCSLKIWLVTLLTIILLLTLSRQVFDFIGRMWVPILVNFVQIIFLIFGFFGVLQFRPTFLTLFCLWTPFFTIWNGFLVCFYLSVAPLDRNELYLGFGMKQRLSHSFWAEYFAFCKASYDHVLDRWTTNEDEADCFIYYYHLEVATAGIFIVLSLLALLLAILFLCCFQRKQSSNVPSPNPYNGGPSLPSRQPTVTVEFSDSQQTTAVVSRQPNGSGPYNAYGHENAPQDRSFNSGYMNTSFESGQQTPQSPPAGGPFIHPNGQLVQQQPPPLQQQPNYQRRSAKERRSSKHRQKVEALRNVGNLNTNDWSSQHSASYDDYSQATTADMGGDRRNQQLDSPDSVGGGGGVVGIGHHRRSRSESRPKSDTRHRQRHSRPRSESPLGGDEAGTQSRFSNVTTESRLSPDSPPRLDASGRAGSQRPYTNYTTEAVARLASQSGDYVASRRSPVHFQPELHNYSAAAEQHRLSTAEVRGLCNSNDSMLQDSQVKMRDERKRNGKNLHPTSLVSFDPKSNTLIRVREHMTRSNESTKGDSTFEDLPLPPPPRPPKEPAGISMQSEFNYNQPLTPESQSRLFPAPPTFDRVSHDSGMPGSISEASTSHPNSSRRPAPPPPASLANYSQRRYEPSYFGALPPAAVSSQNSYNDGVGGSSSTPDSPQDGYGNYHQYHRRERQSPVELERPPQIITAKRYAIPPPSHSAEQMVGGATVDKHITETTRTSRSGSAPTFSDRSLLV